MDNKELTITIEGISGSGKTAFANALKWFLEKFCNSEVNINEDEYEVLKNSNKENKLKKYCFKEICKIFELQDNKKYFWHNKITINTKNIK
jgi:uridine kinase